MHVAHGQALEPKGHKVDTLIQMSASASSITLG